MAIWQRWLAYGAALLFPASLAMAQSADLTLVVTGPATVIQNTNIAFNVTLTNNGPNPSANASFTFTFSSSDASFVSFLQTGGPAIGSTLAAGASETFIVTLHVNPGIANGTVARKRVA